MAFAVPSAEEERLLVLIANVGVESQLQISVGSVSDVEFAGPAGERVFGSTTAARHLASLSPLADQLLGETAEQQAKVAEWLAWRHSELSPLMDDKLALVNAHLLTRTFLAGGLRPSLADLVIYAAVSPAVTAFPIAQHGHFCNLLRWYDHIHHTADPGALFRPASFSKPAFQPPPAAASAAPAAAAKGSAAAAAAAAEAGGKSKGGKADGGAAAAPAAPAAAAAADGSKGGKKKAKGAAAADSASRAPATPAASAGGATGPAVSSSSSNTATAAPSIAAAADGPTVDLLDLRVGQIVSVGRHPNADALYVEEIDLGESQPRQVVSGLVKFVPEDKMLNRRVVVVTNLKPAKMRDVMSYGMVLCASNDAHDAVDPIVVPEGVPLGEKISFEGYNGEPDVVLNPKKKQLDKIAPELRTTANGLCVYRGVPFMTSKGPVTATIPGAHIK